MTALVTKHLPLVAEAPDGIKKLRALILELAVRGRLLPQDSRDEPAIEILLRISHSRHNSSSLKGATKASDAANAFDGAPPFDLPNAWAWVRFGGIAQHNSGKTLDKGRNAGAPRDYITTSNLYWGRFDLSSVRQMLIRDDELERCTARKNDLLICEGGEAGRAAVWADEKEVCFQNHVHRARMLDGISPHYAYRVFERLNASGEISQYRKGVGISNMSSKSLASIPCPLPPIEEQHRIVAKVDELMALCDRLEADQADAEAAHAQLVQALLDSLTQATDAADFRASWQRLSEHFHTLFTTVASIDALKQTVWRLAVAGKLVHQDASDGSAQYILDQVQAIQAASKNKRRNKTATSSRSGAAPFELPAQWVWCELQDAFDVRDGTHDTPSYQSHGVPLVTSKNLSSGRLDMTNVKLISMVDHLQISERSKVDVGDVLFAMIGSIGNPVLVETEQPFSIKNVALFKHYDSTLTVPRYLLLYLLVASDEMRAQSAGGVQSFISLGNLRSFPLPLPPAQEQRRIVAKVDELMALCDQLKGYLAESRQQHAQLATVLVEQAVA